MPEAEDLDELFVQQLKAMTLASVEQIDRARELRDTSQAAGESLSLPDALIAEGVITETTKKSILKQIEARRQGGLKQLGPYQLEKRLGQGAMGAVFLAEDVHLKCKVALKILPKKFTERPQFLTRFRREGKAAVELDHPNIVGAYSVGEELGYHYYAMEYCEGETLDKVLKRDGKMSWKHAVGIIVQVAEGLEYAHQHNLVHRDVKPANIILTLTGEAKLLDLGLCKDLSGDTAESYQTQAGVAVGTPHYISPEQAKGDTNLDGRTDIYSLGATFFHLVTGRPPFYGANSASVILKHMNESLPDLRPLVPDMPVGLIHIIQGMMAKMVDERYANCSEVLRDLEEVSGGRSPSSRSAVMAASGTRSAAVPKSSEQELNKRLQEIEDRKRKRGKEGVSFEIGSSPAIYVAVIILALLGLIGFVIMMDREVDEAVPPSVKIEVPVEKEPEQRPLPEPEDPAPKKDAKATLEPETPTQSERPPAPPEKKEDSPRKLAEPAEDSSEPKLVSPEPEPVQIPTVSPTAMLDAYFDKLLPMVKRRDWGAARTLAKDMSRDAKLGAWRESSESLPDVLTRAQRYAKQAEDAVSSLVGKIVTLRTTKGFRKGKVVGIVDGALRLQRVAIINGRVQTGSTSSIPFTEITRDEWARIFSGSPPTQPADWAAAELVALAKGDYEQARALQPLCRGHPVDNMLLVQLRRLRAGGGTAPGPAKLPMPGGKVGDLARCFNEHAKVFHEAIAKGDLAAMDAAVTAARGDLTLKAKPDLVKALADVATELNRHPPRSAAIRNLVGQRHKLLLPGNTRKKAVQIVKVADGEVTVRTRFKINKVAREIERTFAIDKIPEESWRVLALTPEDRGEIAAKLKLAPPEEWVAHAIRKIDEGDLAGAEAALMKVPSHPLAAHYLARFEALREASAGHEDGTSTEPRQKAKGPYGRPQSKGARLRRALNEGGSKETEQAVENALRWLAAKQKPDGHWDCIAGGGKRADVAVTGLALMALLGAGNTESDGFYRHNVRKATGWLAGIQQKTGQYYINGETHGIGYHHGIAGIAMVEAAGMSRVPATVASAQRAIHYASMEHQHVDKGRRAGWRYQPRQAGDICVSGWFIAQLASARAAGLRVDAGSLAGAGRFLDSVEKVQGPHRHRYGYTSPKSVAVRRTAIGCLSRLYLGTRKHELLPGIQWFIKKGGLPKWGPNGSSVDLYYWYYGSLCAFHTGGDVWMQWNTALKTALTQNQRKAGPEVGSWDPVGTYATYWGRVGQTALAALCLETYYRYPRK